MPPQDANPTPSFGGFGIRLKDPTGMPPPIFLSISPFPEEIAFASFGIVVVMLPSQNVSGLARRRVPVIDLQL